ncbi:proline dehydrogenase family protein [Aneurinibacillus migulanus]|nr:proline dehydrogenase [Aneurinibacillus migulanus]KIV60354.1 proline dehydrogenase [Aneurinibacillus migulanus]KON98374.1 proline dehydrogenase [Aneurinibacillus migulanus]MED0896660.1 proline dehydrogenase [Aneurinibacillus migulanus]MED1617907.1 proline dehydrogenase [Aneurinibacillus migulanus]
METTMKNFFLFLSQNKSMNQAAKKWGLRFGASRFVAGETIREAMQKVQNLNNQGLVCTLDHLGEFVFSREEAIESADYCVKTLDAIHQTGVNSNLSLKLTQLGLDIDVDLCRQNMRRILDTAKKYGNFVRIDMEDYSHCQQTLDLLAELRRDYDNVGTVIQAYLYRTEKDIEDLKGVSLRLVKGAYKESSEVAYPEKKDVDENYKKIIKMHLLSGSYTAIASHDDEIIEYTKRLADKYSIPREQFEFQMLYGIRTQSQIELAQQGYKMRVYVPYGNDWYGYFMRRLAERPANVGFVLKGMVTK